MQPRMERGHYGDERVSLHLPQEEGPDAARIQANHEPPD